MLCAKFGLNGHGVLEKILKKFRQCIFTISLLYLFGKRRDSSFEKTYIPTTQECFVWSLVEICSMVLEQKTFKISSMHFRYFLIISSWKRAWSFIRINFNPFYRFVASLVENEDENVKSLRQRQRKILIR